MYIIEFDGGLPESADFFQCLYEGWVMGSYVDSSRGPMNNPQWSWNDTIIEAAVTQQFQMIGMPLPCGRKMATGDVALTLIARNQLHMELNQDQFAILVKRFQMVPWGVAKLPAIMKVFHKLISTKETNFDK